MSLHIGSLGSSTYWSDLVDLLIPVFTTHLGFVCESDTGSGDLRIVQFSSSDYDHQFQILRNETRPAICILNTDNTTKLFLNHFGQNPQRTEQYMAINYNDTRALLVYDAYVLSWRPVLLYCKSGVRTHHMGGASSYSYRGIYCLVSGPTNDVNTQSNGYFIGTETYSTITGKRVFSPILLPYQGNNSGLCDDYVNDIFVCTSTGGVAGAQYQNSTGKYVLFPKLNSNVTSPDNIVLVRYE